ncbi:MAG: dTMP kinase, partial [Cellulosilyticaceae bacterium]
VRELNAFVCDIYPDLNIIIDIPVHVSMARKQHVDDINRLDLEGEAFHKKVEEGYHLVYNEKKDPAVMIDGTVAMEEMIDAVFQIIQERLEK